MKGRRDEGREKEACQDLLEIGDASWHVLKQLPSSMLTSITFQHVKQATDIEHQVLTMGGLRMVQFAV